MGLFEKPLDFWLVGWLVGVSETAASMLLRLGQTISVLRHQSLHFNRTVPLVIG